MKKNELLEIGIPADCHETAINVIKTGFKTKLFPSTNGATTALKAVAESPDTYTMSEIYGNLAKAIITSRKKKSEDENKYGYNPTEKINSFLQWGTDIEEGALEQMRNAMSLPVAVAGAVMPDAHIGYAVNIGGVLATYNSVVPYAVGVDISCMVKVTITNVPVKLFDDVFSVKVDPLIRALQNGTTFGIGGRQKVKANHPVMDKDWNVTPITKKMKDRAWEQLGTSGSGNHFAEWGIVTLEKLELGLEAGKYVALMSHSGSRGSGAAVCKEYTDIAESKLPNMYKQFAKMKLAWLPMETEAGQEYWQAMNLMGDYASANHEVLHRNVLELANCEALVTFENKHNLCWEETHNGVKVYVHRKGATPAGEGVLGIIPGSMADPAYIVRGKGNAESLMSASHGAGRAMSRTKALEKFKWSTWKSEIRNRGVRLLSGGLDEVPGVYKSIKKVMSQQTDLVEVIGEFMPKIVKMSDDGRAED